MLGPAHYRGCPANLQGETPSLVQTLRMEMRRREANTHSAEARPGGFRKETASSASTVNAEILNERLALRTWPFKRVIPCDQIEFIPECKAGTTLKKLSYGCNSPH